MAEPESQDGVAPGDDEIAPEDGFEAVAGDSDAPSDSGDFPSAAEAFAAAEAELAAQAPPTAEDATATSQQAEDSAPAPEAQTTEPTEQAPASSQESIQGQLARIQTLLEQGRLNELSATERGVLRRIEQGVEANAAKEREFRATYLRFERMRTEDPAAFAAEVITDPDIPRFMKAFNTAHPEVTLDTPDGVPTPDVRRIRTEIDAEYQVAIEETVEQIAQRSGLDAPTIARIQSEAGGKLGPLMEATVNEAARVRAEKMRAEIAKEEREAAEKAAQARYAGKTIITPRQLEGTPSTAGADSSPDDYTWEQAFADAERSLAAAKS